MGTQPPLCLMMTEFLNLHMENAVWAVISGRERERAWCMGRASSHAAVVVFYYHYRSPGGEGPLDSPTGVDSIVEIFWGPSTGLGPVEPVSLAMCRDVFPGGGQRKT